MTVDREQRDAEANPWALLAAYVRLAELHEAELEQAEQRIEALTIKCDAATRSAIRNRDGRKQAERDFEEAQEEANHFARELEKEIARAEQAERERDERIPSEEADRREDAWRYEIVCSVCGWNHNRDESAACDGCEAITLEEFLAKCRDGMPGLVDALHDARTRLAAVPALVEALRYCAGYDVAGMKPHLRERDVARDALAAYEQAQEQRQR